jgi:template-activating factor I
MSKAHKFPKESEASIEAIEKKFDDAQAEIIKFSNKIHEPIFKERDEALKGVEKFWTKALGNCENVMIYFDDEDKPIFDHLAGIRVERSQSDPREASIHFDFEDNEYFSDATLSRHFKIKKNAESLSADFDFEHNTESAKTVINWKSEEKNQTKLRPTSLEEGEIVPGSFFSSFFEQDDANFAVSVHTMSIVSSICLIHFAFIIRLPLVTP